MKIVYTNSELAKLNKLQAKSGFVPTMGSLHPGHFSLVNIAILENSRVIVSIFVNPTQFNDKNDLKNYPHNNEKDFAALDEILRDDDIVFVPDEKEMYPKQDTRFFEFGDLDKVMEGKHRQGHFNGVAQIVSKLFEIVKPGKAYFGEKDLQQLAIIRKLVEILKSPVKIIGCPIIREPDGLAMSSRNQLLSPEERKESARIYQALSKVPILSKKLSVKELSRRTIDILNQSPLLAVEYFEIIDGDNLLPISNWNEKHPIYACVAVKVGKIRLIDNIIV